MSGLPEVQGLAIAELRAMRIERLERGKVAEAHVLQSAIDRIRRAARRQPKGTQSGAR